MWVPLIPFPVTLIAPFSIFAAHMNKSILLLLLLSSQFMFAQGPPAGGNKDMMKAMKDVRARVYGKLIDPKTRKPVEYATILVLWFNKDSLIGGAISNDDGEASASWLAEALLLKSATHVARYLLLVNAATSSNFDGRHAQLALL